MDLLRTLVAVAALTAGGAHAFVFPAPPSGFGGSPGAWTFSPPSGATQVASIMRHPASLAIPTSGGSARLGVAYRLAPQAARVAAAAIFANPYVRVGVGIATWLGFSKVVWDAATSTWRQLEPQQNAYWGNPDLPGRRYSSSGEVCIALHGDGTTARAIDANTSQCLHADGRELGVAYRYTEAGQGTCPAGWTSTPAGCLSPALTRPQFEEIVAPKPMPETVPGELPNPTKLPVDQPVVNPTPGPNPSPQPYFVPTGRPVPNPQYDPSKPSDAANQPYLQPGVRITPSPTAQDPFRVDVQPINKPVDSPDPVESGTDDGGTGQSPKDPPSLCEKHPDIVACQKLGDLTPETLKTKTVTLDFKREDGFGPANGSCPAPKEFAVLGKTMAFRWDLLCDFASAIRPLLIGFAYLSAALAFMGLSRKD